MLRLRYLLGLVFLAGCSPAAPLAVPIDPPRELPGLHNILRVTEGLYSGSSPDGDAGFRSLEGLGVRTVISVDGARPDVERARAVGLRYVHLPIGYDGVPREQALRIARAVRDLPGPVYLHCHHGKHRGPAAAIAARRCLDGSCAVGDALAFLQEAGTDTRYRGLYTDVQTIGPASADELGAVSTDFAETATVPALAAIMVRMDEHFDRLKLAKAAGWRTPTTHPDINPAHEALMLTEQYTEASRLHAVDQRGDKRDEAFQAEMDRGHSAAMALEQALRGGKVGAGADEAFRASSVACTACHGRYRDSR